MGKRFGFVFILLCLAAGAAFTSCYTATPVSVPYQATSQHRMRAVQHWDFLAMDVADRIRKAVDDRPDLQGEALTLSPSGVSSFGRGFQELLKSQLVSRGLQVSTGSEGRLILDYTVQIVRHPRSLGGLSASDELIINAALWFNDRYVVHCSSMYYVDGAELPLYAEPALGRSKPVAVQVINE